jgi:hypothetical protein
MGKVAKNATDKKKGAKAKPVKEEPVVEMEVEMEGSADPPKVAANGEWVVRSWHDRWQPDIVAHALGSVWMVRGVAGKVKGGKKDGKGKEKPAPKVVPPPAEDSSESSSEDDAPAPAKPTGKAAKAAAKAVPAKAAKPAKMER